MSGVQMDTRDRELPFELEAQCARLERLIAQYFTHSMIGVHVRPDKVTLFGTVNYLPKAKIAEKIARRAILPSIQIINKIRVHPSYSLSRYSP